MSDKHGLFDREPKPLHHRFLEPLTLLLLQRQCIWYVGGRWYQLLRVHAGGGCDVPFPVRLALGDTDTLLRPVLLQDGCCVCILS